jgi:ParB family transcriptional regulator, chromosome partitioning protein
MTTAAIDSKRRALGKGLDSLLPRTQSPGQTAPTETEGGRPREIPIELIDRNPFQTRGHINQDQLAELAASITANGVVQPVLVRPQANGRFQLIAGERRWRASELAGKKTIPAILRQVSDEQAMEITIVENLQRADLNPMEQARAFERLAREFHMTQEQMAQRTGKDRATVANFLRLLKLPSTVQARVESGELSFGHARALLSRSIVATTRPRLAPSAMRMPISPRRRARTNERTPCSPTTTSKAARIPKNPASLAIMRSPTSWSRIR